MMWKRTLLVLVGVAASSACEPSERASSPIESDAPAADSVGPAMYAERLLFTPLPNSDAPTALFDFGANVDSTGVQRSMRAWTARGGEWVRLDSASWRMEAMREPWRLVPHGSLRLVVDESGELEMLIYRGGSEPLRLVTGEAIGEWSPARSARLRIRRAEIITAEGPRSGVLLDAHYRLPPDAEARDPIRTAYLTDGRGTHFVVLDGVLAEGAGWMREGARNRNWRGVRLEPTAFRTAAADAGAASGAGAESSAGSGADAGAATPIRQPTAWRIVTDDGAVDGNLELVGGTDVDGVYTARGTLEVEGRSFAVEGVVRHGAE